MDTITIAELYTLDETIAKDIFQGKTYPWEVLPLIGEFILELGKTLSEEEYEKRGENVWIARDARVAPTASINGPAIIGKRGGRCASALLSAEMLLWVRVLSWEIPQS